MKLADHLENLLHLQLHQQYYRQPSLKLIPRLPILLQFNLPKYIKLLLQEERKQVLEETYLKTCIKVAKITQITLTHEYLQFKINITINRLKNQKLLI